MKLCMQHEKYKWPVISEESLKSVKSIFSWPWRIRKSLLCDCSPRGIWVSYVLVYDDVDVNKMLLFL